ncbi:MAG: GNAT family N-acetyltransferase [Treponema sp.]|nr:GNAT family N-acetyltransferase [Treponema sp.]
MKQSINIKNGDGYFYLEQLSPDTVLDGFSCLITEYNDYLFDDALRSQNDHVALTWLLRDRTSGEIVAYMSLIADAIKLSVSEKETHNLNYPFKTIPAMKIAKLAVSHTVQGKYKGLGTYMITNALTIARTCNRQLFACRFLTVDADIEHNESVIEFYQKNGFIPNAEMNNKRNKTISMRKDIYK